MKTNKTVNVVIQQQQGTGLRLDKHGEPKLGVFAKFARWRCRFEKNDMPRNRRRESEIHAYIGQNSAGKTTAAVFDSLPTLAGIPWHCENVDHRHTKAGITSGVRRVLSTVRLLDSKTGESHPLYDEFNDWDQLKHAEHCDVIMDEMTGVAHSRDSSHLDGDIMLRLNQLRKVDVVVRWTAPAWARADKLIRECTKAVTVCYGSYPDRAASTLWMRNRRFHLLTYATADFDEFTSSKGAKLGASIQQWLWGPDSDVFESYNTLESVTKIGKVSDTGTCTNCDGTRRRQECDCDDYVARKKARKPAPRGVPAFAAFDG